MAIIDAKIAQEAEREAREYAQRNDSTATNDWHQQPPPAYEESPGASSSNLRSAQSSRGTSQSNAEEDRSTLPRRQSRDGNNLIAADETMPLLTQRQEQRGNKKILMRLRVKKGLLVIIVILLLTCIGLLILDLMDDHNEAMLPFPAESDGEPIEYPIWSPSIKTNPDYWPNSQTPLWSSNANFTYDAFKSHFLHQYSNGAMKSGQINVIQAGSFSDEEWKRWNRGVFYDRICVNVEARYSNVALRDATRVNKMRMRPDKEGLGIYGGAAKHKVDNPYLSFHIYIALPSERQRTQRGLAPNDGSSYISELDIDVDNMRVGIEAMQASHEGGTGHVTFGDLKNRQTDGGLTVVRGLRANNSIDIHLHNGPIIDVKEEDHTTSMQARSISLNAINGPILLNRVIASDSIHFTTANGGIDIADTAIAKVIKIKQDDGSARGRYRAEDLDIHLGDSDVDISIDLRRDLYSGIPDENLRAVQDLHCQRRAVRVEVNSGAAIIEFHNHNPQIQLDSNVTVKTGSLKVTHDRLFEGNFEASNKLGKVEVVDTRSRIKERKTFIVTTDKRNPVGRVVKGRTWWSQRHSWNDQDQFCVSHTDAKVRVGNVGMYF